MKRSDDEIEELLRTHRNGIAGRLEKLMTFESTTETKDLSQKCVDSIALTTIALELMSANTSLAYLRRYEP